MKLLLFRVVVGLIVFRVGMGLLPRIGVGLLLFRVGMGLLLF